MTWVNNKQSHTYLSMTSKEIRVPKAVREIMPDWAHETILGYPKGSIKQYRYGTLHIREYDSEYVVHVDKVDPRKDALGHLLHDAPEVLAGIAGGLAGGYVASKMKNTTKDGKKKTSYADIVYAAISSGYVSYFATKEIRNYLSTCYNQDDLCDNNYNGNNDVHDDNSHKHKRTRNG